MSGPRVVVVGAGVMGLWTALELARGGAAVTVVDRAHAAAGSSGLSAGVFTAQYMNADDVELRAFSLARLDELERDHGLALRRIGLLRLSHDADTTAAFERSASLQRDHGRADACVVGPAEVSRLVPHFDGGHVDGAMYSPVEGYLDGAELCALLVALAERAGARIAGRTAVTGLRDGGDGARMTLLTDRGELPADLVCNCAGAWVGEVGAALEAPVGVVNERHEAYVFEKPAGLETIYPMVLDYVPGDSAEGIYFRAEGERQLIAGLHSNEILGHPVADPDDCYAGIHAASGDEIVARVAGAFPGLDDIRFRGGWAGLYPHSPDRRPIAGAHPERAGVLVGAGLGGIGLSLAPVLGRALAELALDGEVGCVGPELARALAPRAAVLA